MAETKSGVDEIAPVRGRLFRVTLLARCLMTALFRGRNAAPQTPKTVIVVLTGKLGDVVCGTPVLRALRAHLPAARLVVAGGGMVRALLADSELADDYVDLDRADALERVRALRADAALVTGPSFVPAALLYAAGVPLVVAPAVRGGYSPGARTWPYRILMRLLTTFPYTMGEYAPRERLRALEPLGIVTDDTKKQLGFSAAAARRADDLLVSVRGKFLVGVTVTAGHKIKEWPTERFAAVVDHVVQAHGAHVILLGGPEDAPAVETLLARLAHPSFVTNTQGRLSIDELKALISKLNLFISVDTGPIYIAEAFGVPTVDITGPIDEREQPPRGPLHRNVVPPHRTRPELFVLNARSYNREEALRQIGSITVALVTDAVDRLIADIKK